jgi:subtilisin
MSDRIQFIPDDEKFYDIQDFLSLSQTKNWGIDACLIEEAWKITKGKDVVVAVLDTGISDHVDLQGQWFDAKNFSRNDSHEDKKSGHGTHVAGIIGAVDNNIGCIGIAPNCKIVPMKVLDDNGGGSFQAIEKAIRKCIELGDIDIINMSLGAPTPPPSNSLHQAIKEATDKGIIIVAAAGNNASKVNYPAAYPEVIAVAALNDKGEMAGFSSSDENIDSVAPGVDIYSTYLRNEYAKMSGTSQASPFMAGICALLKSLAKRDTTMPQINNYIDMLRAIDIVCDKAEYITTGKISKDKELNWGFGVPKFANIDWRTI